MCSLPFGSTSTNVENRSKDDKMTGAVAMTTIHHSGRQAGRLNASSGECKQGGPAHTHIRTPSAHTYTYTQTHTHTLHQLSGDYRGRRQGTSIRKLGVSFAWDRGSSTVCVKQGWQTVTPVDLKTKVVGLQKEFPDRVMGDLEKGNAHIYTHTQASQNILTWGRLFSTELICVFLVLFLSWWVFLNIHPLFTPWQINPPPLVPSLTQIQQACGARGLAHKFSLFNL